MKCVYACIGQLVENRQTLEVSRVEDVWNGKVYLRLSDGSRIEVPVNGFFSNYKLSQKETDGY